MGNSKPLLVLTFLLILLTGTFSSYGTIVTVTDLGDSGPGTLRQAIADASSGDTINFSVTGTISLMSEITIDKNLVITGPGIASLTIDGDHWYGIFDLYSSTTYSFEVSGITFLKGLTTYGGAISSRNDNLIIRNCSFLNCLAVEDGGAIACFFGSLLIDNCTFETCSVNSEGGAIFLTDISNFEISNSTFNDCSSSTGGAIYNHNSPGSFTNCTFSANSASTDGGVLYIDNENNVSFFSCDFISNTTVDEGGAVYNNNSDCEYYDCSFTGNHADNEGGALYNYNAILNVYRCTFDNNSATNFGGAVLNDYEAPEYYDCLFINNSASAGGAMWSFSAYVLLQNCTVTRNNATDNAGGLYCLTASPYYIYGSVIYNNTASASNPNVHILNAEVGNSNIQGSGGSSNWQPGFGDDWGDNIDEDPLFVDDIGDYHLQQASPCINTGDFFGAEETDLEGSYRCGTPDMGCYEFEYNITWNGSSDQDWENNQNWTVNLTPGPVWTTEIPTRGNNLTIPVTANDPEIDSYTIGFGNALTINSGAAVTVHPGNALILEGPLVNNGTFDMLSDQADGNSDLLTASDVTGSINVQNFIGDSKWNLIGIPVTTHDAAIFVGDYLQYYAGGNWIEIINGSDILSPMVGYALWDTPKNTTYTFSGTPNTGTMSTPIYADNGGWNLVSNPYPSHINWDERDDTYGAVYHWNPDSENYESWNNGMGSGDRFVSPMEGFFIKALADGNFEVDNSCRVHNAAIQRKDQTAKEETPNHIELIAFNETKEDHFYFLFEEDATSAFDLQYDAFKMLSYVEELPQLYSINGEERYSIDRRPVCESVQLGFRSETSGEFSIMIAENSLVTEAVIEDSKTGTYHDLSSGAYNFSYLKNDPEDRFTLHFSTVGIDPELLDIPRIYAHQKDIVINANACCKNMQLEVYSSTGAEVLSRGLNTVQKHTIHTQLKTGIYVAVLRNNSTVIKQKIFIQ
ncbi:MAG: hypothetical protein C0593_01210 [Marinilabiliales bacterium]|nr:MAG: hypothetical protein C0593_01210 [Marinilabiliales bacterium]